MPVALGSVAAVVVTYNRKVLLAQVLAALRAQTHAVDQIIVVDNGSRDGTAEMVAESFPDVTCVQLSGNLGPAGGFARGMSLAHHAGHDWVWLLEDDDLPEPEMLETCLSTLERRPDLAHVGAILPGVRHIGGRVDMGARWRGRPISVGLDATAAQGEAHEVDCALLTSAGALISRRAIDAVGAFRDDFFMMFEDYEYCLRLRRTGFKILVLPAPLMTALIVGHSTSPPWRGYYNTRNQLRVFLERRWFHELFWWVVQHGRIVMAIARRRDRKLERIFLHVLGAWHAVIGRMGKTLDPQRERPSRPRSLEGA